MVSSKKTRKYKWWQDKKMFGMMLLFIAVSFQIFAFLEIPVMTTIHGYTIGMMLGFYNPFFYLLIAYAAILLMTNNRFALPKWIKIKPGTYLMLVISIIFISTSSGYYQAKSGGWFVVGPQTWNSFSNWFSDFSERQNAWFPNNTNGGVVGVVLYAFFAMILSGVGALIVAVLSILIPLSILVTGSWWKLYQKILQRKLQTKKSLIIPNQDQELLVKKLTDNQNKKILAKNEGDSPFDDPF